MTNTIVKRSILDLWVQILAFLLLLVLAKYVIETNTSSTTHISIDIFDHPFTMSFPIIIVIPLVMLARIVHALYDERYIITPEYLVTVQGRLSLNSRTVRLRYIHIKDVELNKSFHQRFFDVADLVFATSITPNDASIHMKGIRHPHHVKDLIQKHIGDTLQTNKNKLSQSTIN